MRIELDVNETQIVNILSYLDEPCNGVNELVGKLEWALRKIDSEKAAQMLDKLRDGFQFKLSNVGRAYNATYQKRGGMWHQLPGTCEPPHVFNMDSGHLGFVVGYDRLRDAVKEGE